MGTRRTLATALACLAASGAVPVLAPGGASAAAAPSVVVHTQATGTQVEATTARRRLIRALRRKLVSVALSRRGSRYVWGGSGPNEFDCSGLTMWVFQQALGVTLPHYSGAQMLATRPIARDRLRKGDLLFYGPGGSQHVSMYIGRGLQIGANNPRVGIVVDSIDGSYWVSRFAGAGRVHR